MRNDEIEKLYMTVSEAEHRYAIGKTKLYELFQYPGCPIIRKLGRRVLIPLKDFDAFMNEVLGCCR